MMNSYDPTMDSYIQDRKQKSLFKVNKRSAAVSSSLEVESRSNYQRIPTENFKFERFKSRKHIIRRPGLPGEV